MWSWPVLLPSEAEKRPRPLPIRPTNSLPVFKTFFFFGMLVVIVICALVVVNSLVWIFLWSLGVVSEVFLWTKLNRVKLKWRLSSCCGHYLQKWRLHKGRAGFKSRNWINYSQLLSFVCSKLRWCVLLTWNHSISWLSSTTLIAPLIQSELTLELTGRSGSGSLTNIHCGCHATPPLAYQHPKLGSNHQAPLVKLYICFKNAPMCNQPSPTAVRNPADSTPADYGGGSIWW